jgi:predicted nucleotidyltransferase
MIPEKDLIIKLLLVLFPNAKIYLFGSRARGDYKSTSDIDLAIDYQSKKIEPSEVIKAKNVIDTLNIPQKVDIVDFNSLPNNLRDTILKEGVLWKI